MTSISVIIPLYRKIDQFLFYFNQNHPYLADCQIIIVNDYPPDTEVLSRVPDLHHPHITLIHTPHNCGFAPAVNLGAQHATGDILFMLNTDVLLHSDAWKTSVPLFSTHPHLCGVSFLTRENDGHLSGHNQLYFSRGLFHHRALPSPKLHSPPVVNAWCEFGCALIRKKSWDMLGGLDESYAPFYWEDVDFGYRATKRGWEMLLDPRVVVEHHHESTIGAFFATQISPVAYRNQHYFTKVHSSKIQKIQYYLWEIQRMVSHQITTLRPQKA
jgi:GT2 family glycosyltransferase